MARWRRSRRGDQVTRIRGVRKHPWGRYAAEIRDPAKKGARLARHLRLRRGRCTRLRGLPADAAGPKARTNFPLPAAHHHQHHAAIPVAAAVRPASSSPTVESFWSRPVVLLRPPPQPILDGDCRSDCGSSASVVDDDSADAAASPSCRLPLPFDLNLPPDGCGLVSYGDEYELRITALCL